MLRTCRRASVSDDSTCRDHQRQARVLTRIATVPKVQTSKPTQIGSPHALGRAKELTYSPLSPPLCKHAGRYLKGAHRSRRNSSALGARRKGKRTRVSLQKANQPV